MSKYEKGFRNSYLGERLYKRWIRVKKVGCCDEWQDYEAFCKWAIESGVDYGYIIRKYREDEPYSPDNCWWDATKRSGSPTYGTDEFCERWNKTVNRFRVACGMVPFKVEE